MKVMKIPDGNWSLILNAPDSGVTGALVYNGTYTWNSPEKKYPSDVLASIETCRGDFTSSNLGKCREVILTSRETEKMDKIGSVI